MLQEYFIIQILVKYRGKKLYSFVAEGLMRTEKGNLKGKVRVGKGLTGEVRSKIKLKGA
jgi:hypothetical protein